MSSNMNPGGDGAVEAGCICPVMDNEHGSEDLGKMYGFWVVTTCPVHHPEEAARGELSAKSSGDR